MYNSIIHCLCIVFCGHHLKSSLLRPPFMPCLPSSPFPTPFPPVITILLCVSIRGFVAQSLLHFTQPSLRSDSCQSVLCICPSVSVWFVYFSLDSSVSKIIWCLSFSDWLISFNMVASRSTRAIVKGKIFLLLMAE